ncbi:MAG: hypothetical protein J4G15_13660 [Alphaproteobacteria bacterium]|nr:hypothetical protein [Alphaproteobacteria bacterium]
MTPLGHDQPDRTPDILFSDVVIEVLRSFANHARTEIPSTLAAAITVLGDYIDRPPGTGIPWRAVVALTGMGIGYRRSWLQPS